MIIVEGPDGAGKSTLACKLGARVIHSGGPIERIDDLKLRIDSLVFKSGPGGVVDRFPYLSEFVYGQPPIIAPNRLIEMFQKFRKEHSVFLIYCRTDQQTMFENISSETKAHKPPEYLEQIKDRYFDIVARYEELFSIVEPDVAYDWQKDDVPCVG